MKAKIKLLAVIPAFLVFCPRLWAGDCSDASDCSAIPDNGTKAATILSVFAGYGLYLRTRRKKEDDEAEFSPGEVSDQTVLFGSNGPDSGDKNNPSAPGTQAR